MLLLPCQPQAGGQGAEPLATEFQSALRALGDKMPCIYGQCSAVFGQKSADRAQQALIQAVEQLLSLLQAVGWGRTL